MRARGGRVPDMLLEQYLLGELPRAEEDEIAQALRSDAELRERLAALESSNRAILDEYKSAEIAAAIRARMTSSSQAPRLRMPSALLLPAAAAVLLLAGAVMARSLFLPSAEELTRPKGGAPGLSVYLKTDAGPVQLEDGAPAFEGQILQLRYGAGAEPYGAIFSLDGRGTVTRHLPVSGIGAGAKAPRLALGGAVLESAYQLDDSPGFERFFVFSSKRDFGLETVARALGELAAKGPLAVSAAPRLPADIRWKSLVLIKKAAAR